jgi:hypothetical protein
MPTILMLGFDVKASVLQKGHFLFHQNHVSMHSLQLIALH